MRPLGAATLTPVASLPPRFSTQELGTKNLSVCGWTEWQWPIQQPRSAGMRRYNGDPIPGRHPAKPALDVYWTVHPALPLPSLTPLSYHRIESPRKYGHGRMHPGKSHRSHSHCHGKAHHESAVIEPKSGRSRPSEAPRRRDLRVVYGQEYGCL